MSLAWVAAREKAYVTIAQFLNDRITKANCLEKLSKLEEEDQFIANLFLDVLNNKSNNHFDEIEACWNIHTNNNSWDTISSVGVLPTSLFKDYLIEKTRRRLCICGSASNLRCHNCKHVCCLKCRPQHLSPATDALDTLYCRSCVKKIITDRDVGKLYWPHIDILCWANGEYDSKVIESAERNLNFVKRIPRQVSKTRVYHLRPAQILPSLPEVPERLPPELV